MIVHSAVAAVLLIAAALKTQDLRTYGISEQTGWLPPVMALEVTVAMWLLSGVRARLGRLAAIMLFAVFAVISLRRALSGAESCGCFGALRVNPWLTLVLDLAVVIMLGAARWNPAGATSGAPWRIAAISFAVVAITGLALKSMLRGAVRLDESGHFVGKGSTVILEPDAWVGKRLPILPHIDIHSRLVEGDWTIVLYRHDCDDCQRAMPAWQQLAREGTRVALIELPPYAPSAPSSIGSASGVAHGRLSAEKQWFVHTPLVLKLEDGIVRSSSHTIAAR